MSAKTDSTYLRQLKKAYAEWDAGRLNDAGYDEIANRLEETVEQRYDAGLMSEAAYFRFLEEHGTNSMVVHDM